jgi:hypothetical protein
MSHDGTVTGRFGGSFVERLAEFFPNAIRVRIPVRVTPAAETVIVNGNQPEAVGENTVIEFGTENEVLFASVLPLEFEDKVHVKSADGSLDVEASVVAMQLNDGKTAIAARFTRNVANWIIKTGT